MSYFSQVVGQQSIINHLTTLVTRNMLPHSLLFYGESGLGKLNTAIGLASLLIGRQALSPDQGETFLQQVHEARRQDGESEKKASEEGLPIYVDGGTVFWIRPTKTVLKVEQWYRLLQEYMGRAGDGNRVVIVEDFQTANAIMANAMLKTIEEPPPNVYFIIITTQLSSVLPTIRSRCMAVGFGAVDDDSIRQAMKQRGYHGDLTEALAAGHGNPLLVQKLAEEGVPKQLETAVTVLELLGERRFFTRISLLLELLDRETLREVFRWMRVLGRDMMVLRAGGAHSLLQCPLYEERLLRMLHGWSTRSLVALQRELLDADDALRLYVKAALVVDGVIIALRQAVKEDIR